VDKPFVLPVTVECIRGNTYKSFPNDVHTLVDAAGREIAVCDTQEDAEYIATVINERDYLYDMLRAYKKLIDTHKCGIQPERM
jgi:hypothetical protein